MDPISQAAFGAVAAQVSSRRKAYGLAAIVGALGGMAADLDVFVQKPADPLFALLHHRGFSHSLAFIPVGGLLVGFALWAIATLWHKQRKKTKQPPSFVAYWVFATLGYATHGVVDAMTSYGTVLYWPFANTRISWDWVAIIDPIVTLPLLLGVWLTVKKKSLAPVVCTSLLVFAYIGFLASWHNRTVALYQAHLTDQSITPENLRVMPRWLKPFSYRGAYTTLTDIHVANITNPINGKITIEEAGSVKRLDVDTFSLMHPELAQQVEGYNWFTNGFTGIYGENPLILGDYRYGYIDTPLTPLWGLVVDTENNTVEPLSLRFAAVPDGQN